MAQQPSSWGRHHAVSIAVSVVITAVFGSAFLDRVNLVNGNTYPHWMTRENLGAVDEQMIVALRKGQCSHEPIEIYRKRDGYVMRCGYTFLEPSTRTYFADTVYLDRANARQEGKKE